MAANALSPEAANALFTALVGYQRAPLANDLVGFGPTNSPSQASTTAPGPGALGLAGAATNPGYGDLPNTLQGWMDLGKAGLTAGLAPFAGVAAIPGLAAAVATGGRPGVSSLRDLFGFGDSATPSAADDTAANAAGAASNPNVGGFAGVDAASAGAHEIAAGPDGAKGQEMYDDGGFTGGHVGQPMGTVHGQEFVLSAPAVAALGVPFLTALNDHARAMADVRHPMDRMRMMQAFGANALGRG